MTVSIVSRHRVLAANQMDDVLEPPPSCQQAVSPVEKVTLRPHDPSISCPPTPSFPPAGRSLQGRRRDPASRSHDPDLSTPSTAAEIYRLLTNNWPVGDSFISLAGKGSANKKVPRYYPESIGPTPSARGLGRLGDWEEKSRGRGVEAWGGFRGAAAERRSVRHGAS
jgi:hypothetical protein